MGKGRLQRQGKDKGAIAGRCRPTRNTGQGERNMYAGDQVKAGLGPGGMEAAMAGGVMPACNIGNGRVFSNDMVVMHAVLMQAPDKIARRGMPGGKQTCNQKRCQKISYPAVLSHHARNHQLKSGGGSKNMPCCSGYVTGSIPEKTRHRHFCSRLFFLQKVIRTSFYGRSG